MFSKADQLKKNKPKKLRPRKCKYDPCKKWFTPELDGQECCCEDCAIAYVPTKMAKRKRKAIKQFREGDKAELIRVCQITFNKYIRKRDEHLPCISCGHNENRQRHAGHFMPVGSNGHIRFDEANCHSQCSICNNHKSGNLTEYEPKLVIKIGQKEVDRLKIKYTHTWTIDELKKTIKKFKQKLWKLLSENA